MPTSRGFVALVWLVSVIRVHPAGPCPVHSLYMLTQARFSRGLQTAFACIDGRRVLRGGGPLARRNGMDLLTKLPEMSDDALANLRTNAKRLQHSGTPAQKTDAAALLPAVEAEIGARRLAKVKATRSAPRKERAPAARPAKRPKPEPVADPD